jgi:hypothetical protein
MTSQEARDLGGKIDALSDKMDTMAIDISRMAAQHEMCRPIVMGNGKPPLSDRVTALETRGSIRVWVDRTLLAGLISLLVVVVGWVPKFMHWW